ncbi:MAG: SpoIIE family protein phosphatase [Clostridia bacterium]|nr:SpoIIE family protein phosphatase [Clostridia bacterium]
MPRIIAKFREWIDNELTPQSAVANTTYFAFSLMLCMAHVRGISLGLAVVGCSWLQRNCKYAPAASIGGMLGALATADWHALAAIAMVFASVTIAAAVRGGITPAGKSAALAAALVVPVPLLCASNAEAVLTGLAAAGLAFALSFALSLGHDCVRAVWRKDVPSYPELTGLLFALALFAAAFGSSSIAGVRLGCVAAAIVALCAASQNGMLAAVPAIALGLGRTLAGDSMAFVGALAACAIAAGALKRLPKYVLAFAFALAAALMSLSVSLTGLLSIPEALLAALAYALLPDGFCRKLAFSRYSVAERNALERISELNHRLALTADALDGVAQVCVESAESPEGFAARQLCGVSSMLRRLSETRYEGTLRYKLRVGAAGRAKDGMPQSGDSMGVCAAGPLTLVALSDGMGSGEAAHEESSSTIAMLTRLIEAGFEPDEALECLNRMLVKRNSDAEIYSTVDCMLFDRRDGSAKFIKFGAPPSFLVREGKVVRLYAEALPAGILACASPATHLIALRRGDVVVMATDGVSDALEDGICSAVLDCARETKTAQKTAQALLDGAARRGAADDMTVVALRVE